MTTHQPRSKTHPIQHMNLLWSYARGANGTTLEQVRALKPDVYLDAWVKLLPKCAPEDVARLAAAAPELTDEQRERLARCIPLGTKPQTVVAMVPYCPVGQHSSSGLLWEAVAEANNPEARAAVRTLFSLLADIHAVRQAAQADGQSNSHDLLDRVMAHPHVVVPGADAWISLISQYMFGAPVTAQRLAYHSPPDALSSMAQTALQAYEQYRNLDEVLATFAAIAPHMPFKTCLAVWTRCSDYGLPPIPAVSDRVAKQAMMRIVDKQGAAQKDLPEERVVVKKKM